MTTDGSHASHAHRWSVCPAVGRIERAFVIPGVTASHRARGTAQHSRGLSADLARTRHDSGHAPKVDAAPHERDHVPHVKLPGGLIGRRPSTGEAIVVRRIVPGATQRSSSQASWARDSPHAWREPARRAARRAAAASNRHQRHDEAIRPHPAADRPRAETDAEGRERQGNPHVLRELLSCFSALRLGRLASSRLDLLEDCARHATGGEQNGPLLTHPSEHGLARRIDERDGLELDPYRRSVSQSRHARPAASKLVHPRSGKSSLERDGRGAGPCGH
jgi:hypothetical protein